MELDILEHKLKIFSFKRDKIASYMHTLVRIAIIDQTSCPFFSITETCDDFTVVIEEHNFQDVPDDADRQTAPGTWIPLTPVADAYLAAKATGIDKIAKSLILPLADNEISIYCLSSYQSDYILVQLEDLPRVVNCLSGNFNILRKVPEVFSPVKIKTESTTCAQEACTIRPIVHKLTLLKNKYHVTSINADQFSKISLLLVELIFYPEKFSSETCAGYEKFFSFTVVDGNVTLVMDLNSVKRFPYGSLFANDEPWRLIKIGNPVAGLGFSECGIVAQVSHPIADANISEYYISSFYSDHTLVPETVLEEVLKLLKSRQTTHEESQSLCTDT